MTKSEVCPLCGQKYYDGMHSCVNLGKGSGIYTVANGADLKAEIAKLKSTIAVLQAENDRLKNEILKLDDLLHEASGQLPPAKSGGLVSKSAEAELPTIGSLTGALPGEHIASK